jgi:hypothetical protein
MKLVNDTNCVFIVGQILFSEETSIHGMLVNKKTRFIKNETNNACHGNRGKCEA